MAISFGTLLPKEVTQFFKKGARNVSIFGAATGTTLDLVAATRDERAFLSGIAKEYVPEIAESFGATGLAGKDKPKKSQITEEDFNEAFKRNPILQQAKAVSQMNGTVKVANAIIASSVGLLAGLAMSSVSRPKENSGSIKNDPANIVGGVFSSLGAIAAGKVGRTLLHSRGLDKAMENTAHHQIMQIKEKQLAGTDTTAADVLLVQLLLEQKQNMAVGQDGTPFRDLTPEQQKDILETQFPQMVEMTTNIAERINKGMRPQRLLYGLERAAQPEQPCNMRADMASHQEELVKQSPVEASNAQAASAEVLKGVNAASVPEEVVAAAPAPASVASPSYVQRFAPAQQADFSSKAAGRTEAQLVAQR